MPTVLKAVGDFARTRRAIKGLKFLKDEPELAPLDQKCIRYQDTWAFNNWYGYILTENNSNKRLRQLIQLKLENLKVAYPHDEVGKD